MARRVVIHVGAMKSGTTFIQGALYRNRAELKERGILVPGERWSRQINAAWDVRGRKNAAHGEPIEGSWAKLVDEIAAWDGTAVISVELLAPVRPETVARVAGSFGDVTPEIVLSVRDLNRSLPAMWQELVQNGKPWTWSDYLATVKRGRPHRGRSWHDDGEGASARFWAEQDQVGIARRWSTAGPLHLVTVPPPGAPTEVLLERFGEAMGFDSAGLTTAPPSNTSLGAASIEVLRRLNLALNERGVVFPEGVLLRKYRLAKNIMPELGVDDPRIGLPVPRWVRSYTREQHAAFAAMDCTVHGDLADLEPVDVGGIDAGDVSVEQVRAAAVGAYERLRAELGESGDVPEEVGDLGQGRRAVDAAVEGLAGLVEWSVRREPAHA